jgi:hypothetical protein
MPDNMIEELLKITKNNLESARRQECEDRLEIYSDAWEDILKDAIDDQFHEKTRGNVKQMLAYDINVLKRIVNEISVVYQQAATRQYLIGEGEEAKEDERYNELMSLIPVNLTMEKTNQMTNLCNESLIYIVPRNDRIEYDILTPDLVEVYQSSKNAKEIEAICFTQSFVDTKGDTTLYYIYWDTQGHHYKYDANLNPVEIPVNTVWNTTGGGDIVNSTKQIGVLVTYMNYLFKTQSFKQKFFKGISTKSVPKDLIHDPLWSLASKSAEGDITLLDYQVMMDKLWAIIQDKVAAVSNNYGISKDNFHLIGSAESGYSLKIKNLPLEKVVDQQKKLYRWHEKELFEKTMIVNNEQYKNKKIAENGVFKIDFADPEYPESPEDTRKAWSFDIEMGAKSVADYAMFVNPDLKSEDEAVAHIEKNVELNKTVAEETGLDINTILKRAFEEEGGQTE